jgi:hypothetical protein
MAPPPGEAIPEGGIVTTPTPTPTPTPKQNNSEEKLDTQNFFLPIAPPSSDNGEPPEHPVTRVQSNAWRLEHRAALLAQGWAFTRADTEAGRLTANDVIFFRAHGHRP